jgi:hypothetical protein
LDPAIKSDVLGNTTAKKAAMSDHSLMGFDIVSLLDNEFCKLKPRDQKVLTLKVFSDEPATLEEIGRMYNIGGERVRQIKAQALSKVSRIVKPGGQLNAVCIAVREAIGLALPLEVLLSLFPALSCPVEAAECAATWRVIERLDRSFEVKDNWCACPSISEARSLTLDGLIRAAGATGIIKTDAIEGLGSAFPGSWDKGHISAWLEYCGFSIRGDEVSINRGPRAAGVGHDRRAIGLII